MYTFQLSAEHTALIGRALDLMPLGQALPVALYMQGEIHRQDALLLAEQKAAAEQEKTLAVAEAVALRLAEQATAEAGPKPKRIRRGGK